MGNYLEILEKSLHKKLHVLDKVQEYNEKQYECFSAENVDMEGFDAAIEEKGKLIEELNKLDEGFETLYAGIAEQLKSNKDKYAPQIGGLQDLIRQVTEKSVSVQAQEARNKALIEKFFAKEKNQIRDGRVNSKVAYGYYKSLDKAVLEGNRAFDFKK